MPAVNTVVTELTVFFPFYNEEENVERLVKHAVDVMERLGLDYEIILVNVKSPTGWSGIIPASRPSITILIAVTAAPCNPAFVMPPKIGSSIPTVTANSTSTRSNCCSLWPANTTSSTATGSTARTASSARSTPPVGVGW